MDVALKKHFWLINFLFLAVGAWLIAGSINGVVAHKLREVPSLSKTGLTKKGPRKPKGPARDYGVIVSRNFFNSALSAPLEGGGDGPAIDEGSGTELADGDGVASSLRANLVGTIVADQREWSMAMITDQTTSETGVYRVDDRLMEEATVVAILTERVVVNHNGVREYLELQEDGDDKKPPRTKHAAHSRAGADQAGSGIKKIDDNNYTIERGEIEKTLANLNNIAMQARIVPSFKNGEANGFKLFAIRPGSLYSKIGIQNGDIIHKINGFAINSPDKALEVYQKLKSARSIEVELTRRGQSKNLNYSIQ